MRSSKKPVVRSRLQAIDTTNEAIMDLQSRRNLFVQIAFDIQAVPIVRMSDIFEAFAEVIRPEIRNGLIMTLTARDILGGDAGMLLRHAPVFDPNVIVAGRKGCAITHDVKSIRGAHRIINDNPPVLCLTHSFDKRRHRAYACSQKHEIRRDALPTFDSDGLRLHCAFNSFYFRCQAKIDAVRLVQTAKHPSDFRSELAVRTGFPQAR